MTTVRRLLQIKGYSVWTVGPDDSISTVLQIFADHNIGALPVIEGDTLVGIVSERDYVRKLCLQGMANLELPVREFMTAKVFFVRPDQTIEDCMALMTDKHIRHLPVLEDSRLVGIISIGDVVKEVISDREFIIQNLENYIAGRK
jgi:CBS domain-containing protein